MLEFTAAAAVGSAAAAYMGRASATAARRLRLNASSGCAGVEECITVNRQGKGIVCQITLSAHLGFCGVHAGTQGCKTKAASTCTKCQGEDTDFSIVGILRFFNFVLRVNIIVKFIFQIFEICTQTQVIVAVAEIVKNAI